MQVSRFRVSCRCSSPRWGVLRQTHFFPFKPKEGASKQRFSGLANTLMEYFLSPAKFYIFTDYNALPLLCFKSHKRSKNSSKLESRCLALSNNGFVYMKPYYYDYYSKIVPLELLFPTTSFLTFESHTSFVQPTVFRSTYYLITTR